MSDTVPSQQRGSRELWLEAAYDLLIAGGIDAVKVMTIARHLKMTRTGFYWFFDDLPNERSNDPELLHAVPQVNFTWYALVGKVFLLFCSQKIAKNWLIFAQSWQCI